MEEKKNEVEQEVQEKVQDEVKEEPVQEERLLSDDELYAKIQTEKLLKKKKRKKIITLSALCVAMALAVCIIILAVVPVSMKPRCIRSGFADVTLYDGTSSPVAYDEGETGYDNFLDYYNRAFGQSYLSAIFSGSLFSYDISETYTLIQNSSAVSTLMGMIDEGDYLVRLRYTTDQVFTYQNGKPYVSRYTTYASTQLKFTDAYFVVNQSGGMQETQVYIIAKYPVTSGGEQTGEQTRLITVTVKADTNVIYDAWDELTDY